MVLFCAMGYAVLTCQSRSGVRIDNGDELPWEFQGLRCLFVLIEKMNMMELHCML